MSDVCETYIEGLSKDDAEEVRKFVKDIIKAAEESGDITPVDELIKNATSEFLHRIEVAAAIQKRNAYLNKYHQQKLVDRILTNWSDNPGEGLMAALVGSELEVAGARNNVGAAIDTHTSRLLHYLNSKLIKDDLTDAFRSGQYDLDIYKAVDALDKGASLDGIDPIAVSIARIVKDVNDLVRKTANKYGGFIGELDGFVVSRSHDMFKIKANMQGWIDWMMANVDWKRSFPTFDTEAKLVYLTKQAKEFASGVHIGVDFLESDVPSGFGSIAKRMSKSRVFHFNSPDAEFEYGVKWGSDNLYNSIASSIESKGRSIGIMSRLGPNAEMNLKKAVDSITAKYADTPVLDDALKMEELNNVYNNKVQTSVWPVLSGKTMIPGNHIAATVESLTLGLNRMALLGGSAWASVFGDSVVSGFNVARRDKKVFAFFKGIGNYFSQFGRNLSSEEFQRFLVDAGIQNDYMMLGMHPRFSDDTAAITKTMRTMQSIENRFFYLNGQYFVDSRGKAGNALGLASSIGMEAKKSFDNIGEGYRKIFDLYNIDSGKWDIIRRSLTKYNDADILDIEGINSLDNALFESYLTSKGSKPTGFSVQALKDEIISDVRNMYQDQQTYSILGNDYRARATMFGGGKAGTLGSFVRKSIWQFKQFPYTYVKKLLGREVYSKSPFMHKVQNVAGLLIATTISGYISMTLRDLVKGKTPKEFDGKVVLESVARGGGLGIYGDLLYQVYTDSFGSNLAGKLLGPNADSMLKILGASGSFLRGDMEKAGDKMVDFTKAHIPFGNILWIKPILDYVILNQITELMSPGTLDRAERKMQQNYNQEYFMMRPSETQLFGN